MNNNWFRRSRRRFLLDYHIDSWNEEFLSKYDPDIYAEACFQSGATAATYMANTHTGLLSWPSRLGGVMHPGLRGLDMLGATINALHKRSLDAIVYYVFIYVQDYWNKHPEARSVKADGTSERHRINTVGNPRRFATCCFNNEEYRKFSLAELAEICDNYDFEG
ncbi:MAG: alpha-L-fucosidase, partial [Treponema sp.]|nr:alpha-L-fucosidase [Treponema sp.]